MMTCIFHAESPYHILLSVAIADRTNHNVMTIRDTFNAGKLVNHIQTWNSNPFDCIQILPSEALENPLSAIFARSRQVIMARNLVNRLSPDELYVGTDRSAASQALLHYTDESVEKSYFEDGLHAYAHNSFSMSDLKLLEYKLLSGYWYRDVSVYGTSNWVDKVMMIFPKYARLELKNKPMRNISPDRLLAFGEFFSKSTDIVNVTEIMIVDLISSINDIDSYKEILAKYISSNCRKVGVKYHPRETKSDVLGLSSYENVVLFDSSWPAELLVLATNPEKIIGSTSTTMISSKWLDPNIRAVLIPKDGNTNYRALRVFSQLNTVNLD